MFKKNGSQNKNINESNFYGYKGCLFLRIA